MQGKEGWEMKQGLSIIYRSIVDTVQISLRTTLSNKRSVIVFKDRFPKFFCLHNELSVEIKLEQYE